MPEELFEQPLRLPVGRNKLPLRERIIDPTFQDISETRDRPQDSLRAARQCLRKGCENRYQPRQWNQSFCQEPDCQAEVRRWQSAKRQQKWRADDGNRRRQASRDRERRDKQRQQAQATADVANSPVTPPAPSQAGAPSRNLPLPKDFCDRPGCYEATRTSHRNHAKYCSNTCRQAMCSVRDRNRKRRMRRLKIKRTRRKCVRNYGAFSGPRLSFSHSHGSDTHHAQANSSSRPRPPPTER